MTANHKIEIDLAAGRLQDRRVLIDGVVVPCVKRVAFEVEAWGLPVVHLTLIGVDVEVRAGGEVTYTTLDYADLRQRWVEERRERRALRKVRLAGNDE